MKRMLKFAWALALPVFLGTVMVSCNDDDNDNNGSDLRPSLVLDNEGSFIAEDVTVEQGATLQFRAIGNKNAESNKKLTNLRVDRIFNNQPETVLDSTFNENSIDITITATAKNEGGTERFIFTLTDKDGLQATRSLNVTTNGLEVRTGNFNHIAGKCRGAFDLIGVAEIASSGSETVKDLKNTDQAGATFTGSWTAGTNNGTLFREALGTFNYGAATEASIETAYNAATIPGVNPAPSATVTNPSAGDVYLVKLRGTNRFAAIQITTVNASQANCDNTTSPNNPGEITFEYKIPGDVVQN